MYRHLQNLFEDLDVQVNDRNILSKSSRIILQNLSYVEKEIVAKRFLTMSWNVGSAMVLGWMQQANVLSASEYIMLKNEEDPEGAQLILNDLLETELVLLADLLRHTGSMNFSSGELNEIVREAIQRLCRDLCENPSVLGANYLIPLESHLTADQIHENKVFHLKIFLEESVRNTLQEAITNCHTWNKEYEENSSVLSSMLKSIATCQSGSQIFRKLLEFSNSTKFRCWKFYLILLKYNICDKMSMQALSEMKSIAKGYVKSMFKHYLSNNCDEYFYSLMLTARQICCFNEAILGSYNIWYKATIGEMKYTLKTEEFNTTMSTLTNMIEHETDQEILKVHINTAVPAPTYCNEIVLNFKQMCRSRLFYCAQQSKTSEQAEDSQAMDVYVIDD